MKPRIITSLLSVSLSIGLSLPEVSSYAKVSRNGQKMEEAGSGEFDWIERGYSRDNTTSRTESEGRSVQDIVITRSPVYVPPKIPKLKNGEVLDYPSTKRYSTLDQELIAKLDAAMAKKQIQQRFHPPASFEHKKPMAATASLNAGTSGTASSNAASSGYKRPVYIGPYNFKPADDYTADNIGDKPEEYSRDKPVSKPIGADGYPSIIVDTNDKPPASYETQLASYHDAEYSKFPPGAGEISYHQNDHQPSKPPEFSGHPGKPSFEEDDEDNNGDDNSNEDNDSSYGHAYHHPPPPSPYHPHHHHHHEVIYEHPSDDYHDHVITTESMIEINDQRLDKRPYSYYFIGKKLWYIPLYFSIYFIVYIGALILKSIARHKIKLPEHLAEVANHHGREFAHRGWWEFVNDVLAGVQRFLERFGKGS